MPVLDYRPFSHFRGEGDHMVGSRPRGQVRRNTRRMHRRLVKRGDVLRWKKEATAERAEGGA
ncbi:hypothetical protein AB0J01_28195 [Streptomyces sp. NPDC050204]|uniref:hypothetical protein n=1 Tax=Streptomyces sp. NPDC050204 TaxID=3155514 RepID=UPI0034203AA6